MDISPYIYALIVLVLQGHKTPNIILYVLSKNIEDERNQSSVFASQQDMMFWIEIQLLYKRGFRKQILKEEIS
jgi:hypothetical protein